MGKGPYMNGLMVMVGTLMIVQLMVILKVYAQSLLELLVWIIIPVRLMKNVLQRWFQHMSLIQMELPLW